MKARVGEQGVLIPKQFFAGVEEVEIQQHDRTVIIVPVMDADPILQLGAQPVNDQVTDASVEHDRYIYTR